MGTSPERLEELSQLGALLDRIGYNAVICALMGGDYYRWPAFRAAPRVRKVLKRVPSDLRLLLRLFLLHEAVSASGARRVLSLHLLNGLKDLGFLQSSGRKLWTAPPLVLIPAWDKYLWVDDPGYCEGSKGETVYIGDDSYILASQLRPIQGQRALDIGTGTGLLALLSAGHVSHVLASDADSRALERTHINAALNGLQAKVVPIDSDIFSSLSGQVFDYICANPPFLPVPDGDSMHPSIAGGSDGTSLLRSILEGLESHLAPGGRCQVLCSTPVRGDGSKPVEDLGRDLCRKGFDCSLILLQLLPVRQSVARRKEELAACTNLTPESAARIWYSHFQDLGIKSNGTVLVCPDRRIDGEEGAFRLLGPLFPSRLKREAKSDAQLHKEIGRALLSRLFSEGSLKV